MPPDRMWTIGELAEQAHVTVKTVRFYSDRGLLPEAARSSGGHRRYGPGALKRLRTIRALRALGLAVPEVVRVLDREQEADDGLTDVMAEVIDGRLREIGSGLAALRWREAALRTLQDCPPGERAERLLLVGAVPAPPSTAALARFWRRWLPPRLPTRLVTAVLNGTIPPLPEAPTPGQALTFARLHALVTGGCDGSARERTQPAAHSAADGYRPDVLYDGLIEAYGLAGVRMRAGRAPREGEALDCFVAAYADARGVRDTPAFRRGLGRVLGADPRIDRYWQLAGELFGPGEPTPGSTHDWLLAALAEGNARAA
ncbi:MerR family transcriptional regulator [Actinacidiphila alni]|uniref:MerR family transcriptional regulator n=1 Tax=Actinacidiphila alni TaxID=380248 RepID=UPI003F4FB77C